MKKEILGGNPAKEKKILIEDKNQLKLTLIQKTDEKSVERFNDKTLDRRNEIIELLSGKFINLREEKERIEKIIAAAVKDYEPRVPQKYYVEIFRLNNWEIPLGKIKLKPSIVGKYTNEIIYSRYSSEILPALQLLNPYLKKGIRFHKHFQWLTESGRNKFDIFINDAIALMEESKDWYDFRIKLYEKFNVPFQLDCLKELKR